MGFGCPICSERLDRLPAEAQNRPGAGSRDKELNISATPCGHIFHTYCIQKWLTGNMTSSKQCPCCRKDVPKLRCLSLFPTSYDDSVLDDSFSQVGGAPPCNHGEVITSLKTQINRLEGERKEKDQLYELLSADYETVQNRYSQEKLNSDTWMMKAKQYESYEDLANQYESRLHEVERKLKNYTQIDAMLKGINCTVEEELGSYSPTPDSIKSLVEMKIILQAECRNVTKKHNELKATYETVTADKRKLKVQYDKKVDDLKELRRMYEVHCVNGRNRDTNTSPLPGDSVCNTSKTPVGFRGKRARFQEPLSSSSSKTNASLDVDEDVDVFPSMGAKKAKPRKLKTDEASEKKKKPVKDVEKHPAIASGSTNTRETGSTSTAGASEKHSSLSKSSKFDCGLSPITPVVNKQNSTIILSSDSEAIVSDDDDFKIRGSIPGAPLPHSSKTAKALQKRSEQPVLGATASSTGKRFKFKK